MAVWFVSLISGPAIGQSSSDNDLDSVLAENSDPFINVDMAAVLANYGPERSGIPLSAERSVALQITRDALVSNVVVINGSTGIIRDPSGFGFTIGLSGDYLFAFDKSDLTELSQEALSEVLSLYREYKGTKIEIEGHTDAKGSDEYNLTLSERRAASVQEWFIKNGLSQNVISSVGFGETKPIAENTVDDKDNPDGRTLNRRVEIRITTEKRVNSIPTISENTAFK